MADAPAPPPPSDEPETPAQRAARHGYQILQSGSWVPVKEKGPWARPFKPRFGLDWNPDTDPDEPDRQATLRGVRQFCASHFAAKDKPGG